MAGIQVAVVQDTLLLKLLHIKFQESAVVA
jgi:hypothetical protein